MRAGTKTLLFGNHQLVLHPVLVTVAWVRIYRRLPSWREAICIAVHDWGYWGKRDVDGAEGEDHPKFGALLASRLLDKKDKAFFPWFEFCAGHSRFYAHKQSVPISKLCLADKYSPFAVPGIAPLWVLLGRLSGELAEYTSNSKYELYGRHKGAGGFEWYFAYREQCLKWVKAKQVDPPVVGGGL